MTAVPGIPGVNMDVRYTLYNGDTDLYIFTLESFVKNTPEAISRIQNISKDTLSDYTYTIHAFKSMAAAIGAQDISEKAERLEIMAKAHDLRGVLTENAEFLECLEILLHNVKNWLKTHGKKP